MARKARDRYIITHPHYRMNDVSITGQRVIMLGECNYSGKTKRADGKALLKRDKTHYLLRFEDKKWLKENKLEAFYEFVYDKTWFDKFFQKVTDTQAQ